MVKVSTNQKEVHILDLNIRVQKLQPIWITMEQYNSSVVLKKLESLGVVTCTKHTRSRTMSKKLPDPPKSAPVRSVKHSRPNQGAKPANHNPVDMNAVDEAAKKAAEGALEAFTDKILASLPQQQQSPAEPNMEGLADMIQKAVINALGNIQINTGGGSSNTQVTTGPEEPLYIPSNIVDKDVKGNVNIQSETTNSEGLDDAAAALKKLRKSKPKSTKREK